MNTDRNKIITDTFKRFIRRGATSHLKKMVNKTHPADLSLIFRSLTLADQKKLFALIKDAEQKGYLLSELDKDIFLKLIEEMSVDELVEILADMPSDDVADLLADLSEEKANEILEKMHKEDSQTVENLLSYGDDTAGGIMVPDFIALKQDITAGDAIKVMQKDYIEVEMPFYLYVVDEYHKLVGISSLRQLVVVPQGKKLKEFMTTDIISVKTDMDQEEVARIVAQYNILAVPVTDHSNKLVGIVTVDDVIDIIRSEATEDILKMAGAGEEYVETKSVIKSTKIRLPWLFASCFGGIIASLIIGKFGKMVSEYIHIAAFIPVIAGMGGNIGTQSSTIVVRGIATRRIDIRDFWKVVSKELSIGFILGSFYGLIIGSIAKIKYEASFLGLAVGLAVVASMSVAALVGSVVPMLLVKFDIDPAVATGPFVTTAIDIIGIFLYLTIASLLIFGI
ncbi:MAG: magnesium transporter [Deltaproteobacteria bacterium]|nr:magnesium transporter [Deltaproteobacteria bacterium]